PPRRDGAGLAGADGARRRHRFRDRVWRPARRRDARRGACRAGRGHAGADLRPTGAGRPPAGLAGWLATAAMAVGDGPKGLPVAAAGSRGVYRSAEAGPADMRDVACAPTQGDPTWLQWRHGLSKII